ncbi:uncharacterized protein LOC144103721 [Amblyomma americanum]
MYWSPEPRNRAPGVSGTQGRAPPRFVVRPRTPTSMRSPLQSPPVEPQLPPVLFAFPPKTETPAPIEEKLPKRRRKKKKHRKKKSSEEDLPDFLDKAAKERRESHGIYFGAFADASKIPKENIFESGFSQRLTALPSPSVVELKKQASQIKTVPYVNKSSGPDEIAIVFPDNALPGVAIYGRRQQASYDLFPWRWRQHRTNGSGRRQNFGNKPRAEPRH